MSLQRLHRILLPDEERREPRFRAEIERLSLVGCRVIAGICAGVPPLLYFLGAVLLPSLPGAAMVASDFALVLFGVTGLALTLSPPVARRARALGIFLGFATAASQASGMMASREFHTQALNSAPEQQFPMTVTMIMLVGIAALPVKPIQTVILGGSIVAYFAALVLAQQGPSGFSGWGALPLILSGVIVLIATGLTAVVYRQRAAAFEARLRAEESFEALSSAQADLLVERNAASQGRFAALLSHDLNTPLGSLGSAFETLVRLAERLEPGAREREVLAEASRAGRSSFERLNEIATRMRHLTNLDRAERRLVDLNDLCTDIVALLGPELRHAKVELQLSAIPRVECRPQQIGAVLANLVRNAAAAVDDDGRIEVASLASPGEIVVEVRDDGRGIEPERIVTLFEPSFRVEGGRVATTNWGLFVSRSIVAEHGGRLQLESTIHRGTTARMSLPVAY